eukprot:TRINITY_DN3393_c0_g4_i1.p1 TRINITY_DN3393_c0_g4~~TRINITY_DN3393_c0_g4_i1.p1  ORF type:complete len:278 (+),score=55.40 TRINITY_DN3393_c0_g4_i1:70-903(+)
MQAGFKALLNYRNFKVLSANYKANLIYGMFQSKVTQMVRAVGRVGKALQRRALQRLILNAKVGKRVMESQRQMKEQMESLSKRLRDREHESSLSLRKIEELNAHLLSYKSREMELIGKIKAKEKQIATLEVELAQAAKGKRGNHGDENVEARNLEAQLRELEVENNDLKERLFAAESNVGTFIKEMSDLLDSHELSTNACSEEGNNSLNNSHNVPNYTHELDDDISEMIHKNPHLYQKFAQPNRVPQQKHSAPKGGPSSNPKGSTAQMKGNRNYQIS